jgi:hypothetical protein
MQFTIIKSGCAHRPVARTLGRKIPAAELQTVQVHRLECQCATQTYLMFDWSPVPLASNSTAMIGPKSQPQFDWSYQHCPKCVTSNKEKKSSFQLNPTSPRLWLFLGHRAHQPHHHHPLQCLDVLHWLTFYSSSSSSSLHFELRQRVWKPEPTSRWNSNKARQKDQQKKHLHTDNVMGACIFKARSATENPR